MENLISELDVNRFGFKIAKFDCNDLDIVKTIHDLRDHDVKLMIARVDSQNIPAINLLEKNGFFLKDMQVTYRYEMANIDLIKNSIHPEITIRNFKEEDLDDLISIARDSFVDYGHYFANEKLNKDICKEIYPDWARRSCLDRNYADKIFVAEVKNKPIGFLSFKILEEKCQRFAKGGMGAVDKNFRKFGVFRSLIIAGLLWGKEEQLIWEEHNVLMNNYPVNKSFSTLGFVIFRSFVTFHGWNESTI